MRPDDRVLIDFRTSDDAGVYRWDDSRALVQTVDFFTPVVNDPFAYGQIAAANALSDIYAMGARPLTALAIAGFPSKRFELAVMRDVFRGGLAKLEEAGVALLGGHTVQDAEIKFGYAVTGVVDPSRVLSNAGARPGDVLLLTKPLGTGIVATAIKAGRATPADADAACASMTALNRIPAEVFAAQPPDCVHACTDITGFGLLGHGCEVARASGVTLRLDVSQVPLLPGVPELARRNRTSGGATNAAHFEADVQVDGTLDALLLAVLYDPQTSGGLLAAVDGAAVSEVMRLLTAQGIQATAIGEVVEAAASNVVLI